MPSWGEMVALLALILSLALIVESCLVRRSAWAWVNEKIKEEEAQERKRKADEEAAIKAEAARLQKEADNERKRVAEALRRFDAMEKENADLRAKLAQKEQGHGTPIASPATK